MTFNVRIHNVIENGKPLKAVASVTMDGMYAVHNIRVIQTEKGTFIGMPFESYKNKDGKDTRRDVFHPVNSEARKAMEDAVIAAYNEKVNADVNA